MKSKIVCYGVEGVARRNGLLYSQIGQMWGHPESGISIVGAAYCLSSSGTANIRFLTAFYGKCSKLALRKQPLRNWRRRCKEVIVSKYYQEQSRLNFCNLELV